MAFEIAFKPSLFMPTWLAGGNGNPRPSGTKGKAHVIGRDFEVAPDGKNNKPPSTGGKYDERGCRRLETIAPGEVKRAHQFYEKQLKETPYRSFMAADHFYTIELSGQDGGLSVLFGRANVCLPVSGPIQNIRELELHLPQQHKNPDSVVLHPWDIHPSGNIQSYGIRVRLLCTEDDKADFARFENIFLEAGFVLEYQHGYLDLLDLRESQNKSLPLFHVISSRWFASISDSLQEEIRSRLRKLIELDSLILNYHPDHLPPDVKSLNRELEFQPGYTKLYLLEPRNPDQVLQTIQPTFNKLFLQPIK